MAMNIMKFKISNLQTSSGGGEGGSGISPDEVQEMIDSALASYASTESVQGMITEHTNTKPHLSKATITSMINNALANYPNTSVMNQAITDAIAAIEIPEGITEQEAQTLIDSALVNYSTTTEVQEMIQEAGGITPGDVQTMIDNTIDANADGFDDTKVYAGVSEFPPIGLDDVLYIDSNTGNQYIWDGSKYTLLTDSIKEADIMNVFNQPD